MTIFNWPRPSSVLDPPHVGMISATMTMSAALAVASCMIYFLLWSLRSDSKGRLPPGPPRLPFIGSVHHLPLEYQHRTFAEWAKTYGDIIYIQLFGQPALALNSVKVAQDLLEKRSAKYSDRPRFTLTELMGWDAAMSIIPYGDRWRRHRRWFADAFQVRSVLDGYMSIQRRETHKLLAGLLESPEAYVAHIKRFVGALMMEIAYGHEVMGLNDEFVVLAEKAVKAATEAGSPASTLVDFIPILRYLPTWMPGGGWKIKAMEGRMLTEKTTNMGYERVQDAIAAGTARACFLWSLIEETVVDGKVPESELHEIKGAANLVYGAGTDTTATVLVAFFLSMVLHPDVCKKAQEEIDRVVGHARLPEFKDRASLLYVECILKEVYRWIPAVPLGLPHRSTECDVYHSYDIPAGSMIMPNIWAMSRNSIAYPDPDRFYPERFLDMDSATAASTDPRDYVFGFGRRICPGKDFGDASVWYAVANVLAVFDIRKARDAAGEELTPEPSFAPGMISHIRPFMCDIRPRSRRVVEMIEQLDAVNGSA